MKKRLSVLCYSMLVAGMVSSCGSHTEKVYYSHRGRVKHVNKRTYPPWYTSGGGRYNRIHKQVMRGWSKHIR